ncbi:1-phosphofructokinase family hexose kinase [Aliiroseovarius crassostreae]|uniref:Phosphofructokinase n=1 Tax=Aliiroseovarius crassostreae TaxID=154981 RepID=A0A9Q9H718_9RHOB|nr:1-phosphofructokinase family hexose kinase [Aliiroseovarius crassostreae]UWP94763.1 1-phosphofructokinase family hexose kinase [Aliiroseovarius crassostreae]
MPADPLPILTLTLNPSLDLSTEADHIVAGDKIRCDTPRLDPGGGGINVARAIRILGGEATALVALAGHHGAQVAALLAREDVPQIHFELPGETRLSVAVGERNGTTPHQTSQYRFVMPGPTWTPELSSACLDLITTRIKPGMLVVLSGYMPPGVTHDFIEQLAIRAARQGGKLILDTSGAALNGAVRNHGHGAALSLLRLDQSESEALAGQPLPGPQDAARFARMLIRQGGADQVVLGRGAEGSVLVTADQAWHGVGPDVPVRSKVGAGDSFLGAFTLALARGQTGPQALCHGVAAASAAVMSEATALCRRPEVEAIVPQVSLSAL